MEDQLFLQRYERLMRSSASALNNLQKWGFSWNNCSNGHPRKSDSPMSSTGAKEPETFERPIVLSSGSDSEDNVPLSHRLKRPKVSQWEWTSDESPKSRSTLRKSAHESTRGSSASGSPKDDLRHQEAERPGNPHCQSAPVKHSRQPKISTDLPPARQKEAVIDLEADKEPDMGFTTASNTPPMKKSTLKSLRRLNPGLADAVAERQGCCPDCKS